MIYKKELFILVAIVLSASANSPNSQGPSVSNRVARKVNPLRAGQELIKNVNFNKLFQNLRRNHSPEEVRMVGTIGLISGAIRAEEAMRENLYQLTDELLNSFNKTSPKVNMQKLIAIEETINRDKSVIAIVNGMMEYARNATTLDALQSDMQHILKENDVSSKRLRSKKLALSKDIVSSAGQKSASTGKLVSRSGMNLKYTVKEKLYDVREMIDNHVENIHSTVTEHAKQTIMHVQNMQKSNKQLMKPKPNSKRIKLDPSLASLRRLWDQVASDQNEDAFDVALQYQNVQPMPELEQSMKIVDMPRLTKGETLEVEVTTTPKMDKINVDTRLDRFKRSRYGRQDNPFMIEVDLGGKKMKKRKDDDDENNEIDGGKDESGKDEKSEQKEEGEEFDESSESEPQGGLVGLITNLSGGEDGSDVGAVLGALSQVVTNLLGPGGLDIPGLVASGSALIASLLAGDQNFGKVLGNIFGLAIDGFSGGGGAENNGQFFGQFTGKFIAMLSADPEEDGAPLQPDTFIENFYDGIGKGSADDPDDRQDEEPAEDNGGSDSSGFLMKAIKGFMSVFAKASMSSSAGSAQGSMQSSAGLSGSSSNKITGLSSGSSGSSSGGSSGGDEKEE